MTSTDDEIEATLAAVHEAIMQTHQKVTNLPVAGSTDTDRTDLLAARIKRLYGVEDALEWVLGKPVAPPSLINPDAT